MTILKSKKKPKLLASKKSKLSKLTLKSKVHKTKSLKIEKKPDIQIKSKKKKIAKKKEEELIENVNPDGYIDISKNLEMTKEDEKILEQFQINFSISKNQEFESEDIFDKIQEKIEIKKDEKKQNDLKENILNDPDVKAAYKDIAKLMRDYTSGDLCKPFKMIPLMDQWDKLVDMTKPSEWSPQAMYAATKLLSSSLDVYRARIFYEKYLLETIRGNIKKNKKLNYHYYQSLIKAFYKPAAWFKGLLFPLCKSENVTVKEVQIFGTVLAKLTIPVMHSSVAMLKLAELGISSSTIIFLKIMIEKRYALPIRVVNALVQFILAAEQIDKALPVVWFQLVLSACELYSKNMDEMQKSAIKDLVKKKNHHILTNEIIKVLENKSKEEIMKNNLEKAEEEMNIE